MLKDFYETTSDYADIKIKSNYHTHNYLCGHAIGTVSDYVRAAVECGLETLGVSDHCMSPLGSYDPYMTPETMPRDYLPQFDRARGLYGDRIELLRGAEIEFFSGYNDYYVGLLKMLDYLVLGQHEYILNGRRKNSFCDGVDEANVVAYFENVIAGLESGFFAVLAHPDLIFYRRPTITPKIVDAFDEVVRTAKRQGVALELNANGIRNHLFKYPSDLLVELCKKYDAPVVVSSDCHNYDEMCDEFMLRLISYARKHGLNIVDKLRVTISRGEHGKNNNR